MPSLSISVVGAACRLPGGAHDLATFTRHSLDGHDAIGPPPGWRGLDALYDPIPGTPGRTPLRVGGFLDADVRDFDAERFGMNAREAQSLDPQQRLLLEVATEALHHAGTPPGALDPHRTGVYVGISASDFKTLAQRRDPEWIDPYAATGVHPAAGSGRLAYHLGLHGETLSVDTACSSGLVALHLACRAIASGRLDAAVVAAVNVVLDPESSVSVAATGALSPSGRARVFSADADGYVRSEGAVALLLRAAPRPEDRVLCTVLATACNQDGRSNGLAAPNGRAQEALLRAALAEAGIEASAVAYHEAHGTGTRLGDAVELGAIASVHAGRPEPLWIGSVKSRIGHLEAAAGLAGFLHAVVALRAGRPRSLHADPPSEALAAHLRVSTGGGDRSDVATVSAFGIGGTNAHVVLARAEERAPEGGFGGPLPLLLSAPSEGALERLAREADERLAAGDARFLDLAATASAGRAPYRHRLAVVAADADEARAELARAMPVAATPGGVVFLYPGIGLARAGMGRALYDRDPVARAAIDRCLAAADPLVDLSRWWWGDDPAWLDRMAVAQAAVFAVGWALTERLRGWGVHPTAVLGHSAGEALAACVAGVLSVEDAVALSVLRGDLLDRTGAGRMAVVFAGVDVVLEHLPPGPVGVAAENHPHETVISGPREAVEERVEALVRAGVGARMLAVPCAAHSSLLDPHLPELARWFDGRRLSPPALPLISSRTGERAGAEVAGADHWVRQLREPVRFGAAARAAAAMGATMGLDLGPHPVLAELVEQSGALRGVATLRRDRADERALPHAIAELWLAGASMEGLAAVYPGHRVVDWPEIPYDRRRHWLPGLDVARAARAPELLERRWRPALPPGPRRCVVAVAPAGMDPEAATRWAVAQIAPYAAADHPPELRLVVDPRDVGHAAVVGVAQAATREVPALACSVVVAAPGAPPDAVQRAMGLAGEHVRVEPDGSLSVARLVPRTAPSEPFSARGVWLVTGGRGALGAAIGRWLAERGAERVIPVGRTGEGLRVDVSDRGALAALLADVGPVAGVVHAAGVLHDGAIHAIDPASIERVFAGKVRGAVHLAELLPPDVLLVLLSSFAAVAGGRGQAVYAAANAVLDEIASARAAAGGRAIAVGMGPWSGSGMAAATAERRRREGLPPMAPAAALAGLGAALQTGLPYAAVVDVDRDLARAADDVPPVLGEWLGVGATMQLRAEDWRDHAVDGQIVVSAADRLVWACEGGPLRDVALPERLVIPEGGALRCRVERTADEVTVRGDGRVGLTARPGERFEALPAWEATEELQIPSGTMHGPSYRRAQSVARGGRGWVAELTEAGTAGQKLDAAFVLAGLDGDDGAPWLPTAVEAVWVDGAERATRAFVARIREDGGRRRVDLALRDAEGRAVAAARGVVLQRVARRAEGDRVTEVVAIARKVLGLPADAPLDPGESLLDRGLDSVLAVELRNRLQAAGIDAPLHRVMGGASARALVPEERAPEPLPQAETLGHTHAVAAFVGAVFGAAAWAAYGAISAAW